MFLPQNIVWVQPLAGEKNPINFFSNSQKIKGNNLEFIQNIWYFNLIQLFFISVLRDPICISLRLR